jgi:DNA-nicking Smr family endonuclease
MTRHSSDPFDPLDGPVGETIDLHRLTAAEARPAVLQFLKRARRGSLVHVITGKGRNSTGGPVLLTMVRSLLKSRSAPEVAAWGVDDHGGGYLIRIRS